MEATKIRAQAAARRAQVVDLHRQGYTYRQIAERLELRLTVVRGLIQYARGKGELDADTGAAAQDSL